MEDVRGLKVQRVEAIDQAVTSGKRFERIKLEVQATNGDTYEKMAEMLTRAQRERLKEMRGRPFTGARAHGEPKPREKPPVEEGADIPVKAPVAPVEPAPAPKYMAPKPGLYDLELKYLDNYDIGKELKLTNGQSGSAARAWLAFPDERTSGRIGEGKEVQVHEYTEKSLTEILTPAQRTRFNEIMMQRRSRVSPEAACTYPPTISALKLTPAQLQQLAAGKRLAEVLSKEQINQYQKLLGVPFELPVVIDEFLPARAVVPVAAPAPPAVSVLPYANARDFLRLTDRLGLSAEQINKLRELAEDEPKIRELIHKELSLEESPPLAGAGRAVTAETAVADRYRAAVEQQCWDTLDPAQQSIARKLFGRGR